MAAGGRDKFILPGKNKRAKGATDLRDISSRWERLRMFDDPEIYVLHTENPLCEFCQRKREE